MGEPPYSDGFEIDPFAEFEAQPLPRFTFTSERRAAAALRKKAVEVLESHQPEAMSEWTWWAKLAEETMKKGYDVKWKMGFKGFGRGGT